MESEHASFERSSNFPCIPINFSFSETHHHLPHKSEQRKNLTPTPTTTKSWKRPREKHMHAWACKLLLTSYHQICPSSHNANAETGGGKPSLMWKTCRPLKNLLRPCLVPTQKKFCDGILLIWSTKWSLFIKLFAQMGCKSRNESNNTN